MPRNEPSTYTRNLLSDRLLKLRKDTSLTQVEFCKKHKLSYKHYQGVESGRRKDVRLSTLQKIADAYDVQVWELLVPKSRRRWVQRRMDLPHR